MAACECSLCKEVFAGLTLFDQHQDVDYNRQPRVICRDPAALGMTKNRHGHWGRPRPDDPHPSAGKKSAGLTDPREG